MCFSLYKQEVWRNWLCPLSRLLFPLQICSDMMNLTASVLASVSNEVLELSDQTLDLKSDVVLITAYLVHVNMDVQGVMSQSRTISKACCDLI